MAGLGCPTAWLKAQLRTYSETVLSTATCLLLLTTLFIIALLQ